jgi:hypothetical protein
MSDPTNSETNAPQHTPLPIPPEVADVWRQSEARLKLLRSELEQLSKTNSPAQPTSSQDQAKMKQVIEILDALAKDPFALINRAVQDANDPNSGNKTNSPPAQPPKPAASPTNTDPALQTPAKPTGTNSASAPASMDVASDSDLQDMETAAVDATSEPDPTPASVQQPAPQSDFNPSFDAPEPDAFGSAASQAQASGDRMRAALEQNTQLTATMFDQMLALIDGQNQKLGDVDRKISELSGQLDSIKNT